MDPPYDHRQKTVVKYTSTFFLIDHLQWFEIRQTKSFRSHLFRCGNLLVMHSSLKILVDQSKRLSLYFVFPVVHRVETSVQTESMTRQCPVSLTRHFSI